MANGMFQAWWPMKGKREDSHVMKIVNIASILVHIELTPLFAHNFLKFHYHKKL
jgi:hypothetical protein